MMMVTKPGSRMSAQQAVAQPFRSWREMRWLSYYGDEQRFEPGERAVVGCTRADTLSAALEAGCCRLVLTGDGRPCALLSIVNGGCAGSLFLAPPFCLCCAPGYCLAGTNEKRGRTSSQQFLRCDGCVGSGHSLLLYTPHSGLFVLQSSATTSDTGEGGGGGGGERDGGV